MRKSILLVCGAALLLTARGPVMAQGLKFGLHHDKRLAEVSRRGAGQPADRTVTAAARKAPAVEQMTDITGNVRLRYTFGYDRDMQRTSESIYASTRDIEGEEWSQERLLTVGSYRYEYDTQGRIKKKTVSYTEHEGVYGGSYIHFDTYYIEVDYDSDGLATYSKYEQWESGGEYHPVRTWQKRSDGTTASITEYFYNDGTPYIRRTFTPEGHLASYENYSRLYELQGSLNDSTIVVTDKYSSYDNMEEHYRYDGTTGRLLEYSRTGESSYSGYSNYDRYLFTYDAYGRISKVEKQMEDSDDEYCDPVLPTDMTRAGQSASARRADEAEVRWVTEYSDVYTYSSDEVYPMSSPWRAVFGMEGPLASVVTDDEGYVSTITFARDSDGKLTSVTCDIADDRDGTDGVEERYTVTVDDAGHIVRTNSYSRELWNGIDYGDGLGNAHSYGSTDETETTYTWQGDKVAYSDNATDYSVREDGKLTVRYRSKSHYDYKYTAGGYEVTRYGGYSDNDDEPVIDYDNVAGKVSEEQNGTEWRYADNNIRMIRKVQDRDLSFRRPNLVEAYDGIAPDSVIVVSVAGRVAVVKAETWSSNDFSYHYGFDDSDYYSTAGEIYNYVNMTDNWFDVADDNGLTVCSDVEGKPVYVLDGTRLMREYDYYQTGTLEPVDPGYVDESGTARRVAGIPDGQEYDELIYDYDESGLLTTVTRISVDWNGERTEEITTKYTYDPTGISSLRHDGGLRIALDGRELSCAGGTFSVTDMSGRVLADGASAFTLPSAGVYIVRSAAGVRKITVR